MWAVQACRSSGHSLYRLGKSGGQFDLLAGAREELRSHATAQILVLAPEFQRKIPMRAAKQFFGVELRTVPGFHLDGTMAGNAEFVGSRDAQHLDPGNRWRDHDRVRSIDCQRIDCL